MADIFVGPINLTEKQMANLSAAQRLAGVRGYSVSKGELTVNHEKETLSDQEKSDILAAVRAIPDDDPPAVKARKALKEKPVWTLQELTDVVKTLI